METESVTDQLDATYRSLWNVAALDDADIQAVVNYVLVSPFSPQSWFNLFLYMLERETQASARRNVVQILSDLVLRAGRGSPIVSLVHKEIAAISHASDSSSSGCEVRIFLHQCIFAWIQAGIVSAQFLKRLQQEEEKWRFRSDRPQYSRTPQESPPTFDLVLLGIQGRRRPDMAKIDMGKLVQQGMELGVREGWMRIDERGRHVVSC